jgi:hypothetical protein
LDVSLLATDPMSRKKRSYETLQPTEKWKRRTKAKAAVNEILQEIGVPIEEIHLHLCLLLSISCHLPTSLVRIYAPFVAFTSK